MLNNSHYIDKLRSSGLRPTKQRIKICEILFNTEKTFHFTINDLVKKISKATNDKISLATVYNTVHAFKKKGYLKEIPINSDQSYFDTITSHHHHFYDEVLNCEADGVVGTIASVVGSIQANEVIKNIVGIGKSLNGKVLIINLLNLDFRVSNLKKIR